MYDKSILDIVQDEVNLCVKEKYKDDDCQPKYIVSLYSKKHDVIMLTVTHNGRSFSQPLFPCGEDSTYGYDSIEYIIESLYNKTV